MTSEIAAAPGWRGPLLRSDRVLWAIVDAGLLLCVAGIVTTVTIQVISRLLGASLPWTEELSRILFIWTAFLGMSVGFRRLEHPRILLAAGRLGARCSGLLAAIYALACVAFFAVAGWFSFDTVVQQISFGETSPVLGVGMYLVTLPMALSCPLAIVAALVTVYVDPAARARLDQRGADRS